MPYGAAHTTKGLNKKGTARQDRRRTNFHRATAAPRAQVTPQQFYEHFLPRYDVPSAFGLNDRATGGRRLFI